MEQKCQTNERGALKNSKWTHHGLASRWVEYEKETPQEEPKQSVYYVKSGDTLSSIAKANNMSLAKLVSYNPQIKDINKISVAEDLLIFRHARGILYSTERRHIQRNCTKI